MTHWTKQYVDICAPIVDADGVSDFLVSASTKEGCYVSEETHNKLLTAMKASNLFVKDGTDADGSFDEANLSRGITYYRGKGGKKKKLFRWWFWSVHD